MLFKVQVYNCTQLGMKFVCVPTTELPTATCWCWFSVPADDSYFLAMTIFV
jgi:hypothetical protein